MAQTSPDAVQQHATETGVFEQDRISLIGIAGTPTAPRALVRLSGGAVQTVTLGDKVKGSTVVAIGPDEIRLSRFGRVQQLTLPPG